MDRAASSGSSNVKEEKSPYMRHHSNFFGGAFDDVKSPLHLLSSLCKATLATALFTGLIKQWIHFYGAEITGDPRERACIRQFRYKGLFKWGVVPIIEILPLLMNKETPIITESKGVLSYWLSLHFLKELPLPLLRLEKVPIPIQEILP